MTYTQRAVSATRSIEFKVNEWPDEQFTIPMVGEYNVNNALAAMVASACTSVSHIKTALANVELTKIGRNGSRARTVLKFSVMFIIPTRRRQSKF